MSSTRDPLTDSQIDQLDAYLLSDKVQEEALDYIALHGYLCALAISPAPMSEHDWLEQVMAEKPVLEDSAERHEMLNLIRQEFAFLQECLESDQDIDLPCDLTLELDQEDDCLLEYWAQGFMELIFSQEDVWFSEQEEDVAECLLPFMLAAKLDEDEELDYHAFDYTPKVPKYYTFTRGPYKAQTVPESNFGATWSCEECRHPTSVDYTNCNEPVPKTQYTRAERLGVRRMRSVGP